MTDKITPPWDEATVAALNEFQHRGGMHPFTCPRDHFTPGEAVLVAFPSGWVCSRRPACGYTQDWAHTFMADRNAWPLTFQPTATEPTPLPPLPLHQRLIEAAWQDGLMHLDGPEPLVARVLRELATSMSGDRADEIRMLAAKCEAVR